MRLFSRNLENGPEIPEWSVPLILLGICFLSFGLLAHTLGLYWDDWSKTLVNRLWGLSGYWNYYLEDRPVSSWTHIFFISLIGDNPFRWQILVTSLRWLSSVALWWALKGLWPSNRRLAVFTACLFVVYPLFTQQAIAVTFHQQWLQYLLCFLSFGSMIYAFRMPHYKIPFTILSLLTMVLQLSVTEYFVGIEMLRPLILWFLVSADGRGSSIFERLRRLLGIYWPYLVLEIAYILWRLFFIRLTGQDPYRAETLFNLLAQPLQTISKWSLIAWRESIQMLISHWYRTFQPDLFGEKMQRIDWASWGIALIAAVMVIFFLYALAKDDAEDSTEQRSAARQAMLLGLLGMLLGAIPAWITGRLIIFDFHSDRYALPAMFGASLLTVGFLEWLIPYRLQKAVVMGVLVGLAIGFNLRTVNEYRLDWLQQQRFYWELYWRAPYLQPGTALLTDQEPFPNQGLFSFSSAINLLYPQAKNPQSLPYWVYALGRKYTPGTIPHPLNTDLYSQFRSLVFKGNTADSIAFYYDPSQATCLWVFGPDSLGDPGLPRLGDDIARVSDLQHIQPNSTIIPPTEFFGNEPEHTWCYYFEKADLARQEGNWNEVVKIGDEARQKGYDPQNQSSNTAHEWIPFLQGYAQVGRWEDVKKLNGAILKVDPRYKSYMCHFWEKMGDSAGENAKIGQMSKDMYRQMGCKK